MPDVAMVLDGHITDLTDIEDGTRRRHDSLARQHINPHLGQLPVDLLTRERAVV